MVLPKTRYKLKNGIIKIIVITILTIGGITMVFPFFWMLISSFKPSDEILSITFKLLPTRWTLENFKTVFDELTLGRGYLNSFFIASISTISVVLFSALGGYLFSKLKFRGRNLIFYMVLLSMMIPYQTSLISLYFFANMLKLVDTYAGILLTSMMSAFGIFLTRQFLTGIPDSILESARIDGANDFGIFLRILLPLLKPVLSIVAILTFVSSWDSFLWPLVIIDSNELKTLPILMSHFAGGGGVVYIGESMAAASLVVIPIIFIYIFFQQNLIKSLALTGIKG